eukprot:4388241-Ditylum_brightwellii.AAC.1
MSHDDKAINLDELSSNLPKVDEDDKKVPAEYDRWTLRDPASIDYGYFGNSTAAADLAAGNDKGYYITTAINYTNGPAHMGHAYEAATSDSLARFARLVDGRAFFLTGTDEHGEKIAKTAEGQGKEPIDICDK